MCLCSLRSMQEDRVAVSGGGNSGDGRKAMAHRNEHGAVTEKLHATDCLNPLPVRSHSVGSHRTTGLRIAPIPAIATSTTSPGARNTGGL